MIIFECYTIGVLFGFDNLNILMKERTGETIPKWMINLIMYVSMPLAILLLIGGLLMELKTGREIWWS